VKQEFIDTRTEGYEDFKKELLSVDIAAMEKETGVDRELVRKAAIAYASHPAFGLPRCPGLRAGVPRLGRHRTLPRPLHRDRSPTSR